MVADLESLTSGDQLRVTQEVYGEMEKLPPFRPRLDICGCLDSTSFEKANKVLQFNAAVLQIILYLVLLAIILPNLKIIFNILSNVDVIMKTSSGMIQGAALGAAAAAGR